MCNMMQLKKKKIKTKQKCKKEVSFPILLSASEHPLRVIRIYYPYPYPNPQLTSLSLPSQIL